MDHIRLLTDKYSNNLANRIYKRLSSDPNVSLTETIETKFADGELLEKIPVTMRHTDVYYIHSMHDPEPNQGLIRLMLTIDAISRADVESLTLILPYMIYQRQDRKDEGRVPISARMVADMISSYPVVRRIQTMDLHTEQAVGFYRVPVDNMYGRFVQTPYFRALYKDQLKNLVVYSPDLGGAKRAKKFADTIGVISHDIRKDRSGPNQSAIVSFGGNPKGKDVIIFDDMIDTAGTMINAGKEVLKHGANKVYACATHWLGNKNKEGIPAEDRFKEAGISVVVTESVPRTEEYWDANKDWLTVLPLDELFATSIKESSKGGGSISKLFKEGTR